jgi:hypothetical protein
MTRRDKVTRDGRTVGSATARKPGQEGSSDASASEGDGGVEGKQELIFSAIKWPVRLVDTVRPVITDIWPDIKLLHRLPVHLQPFGRPPVHAQRNRVIIGGCAGERITCEAESGVVGSGYHPERGKNTKAVPVAKPLAANTDGEVIQQVIIQMRINAIPLSIFLLPIQQNPRGIPVGVV